MKRYFNTKEKAQAHLEYRRKCAYTRIEKRKDKLLADGSFVTKNEKGKWYVWMQIYTENMMKDLHEAAKWAERLNSGLIPFSNEEKIVKKQLKMKKVESKYKTLDIEDYTINKDL
jgi:hypothetical protein